MTCVGVCMCVCQCVISPMTPHGEQAQGRCDAPDVILYVFFLLCTTLLPPNRRTNMHTNTYKYITSQYLLQKCLILAPSKINILIKLSEKLSIMHVL